MTSKGVCVCACVIVAVLLTATVEAEEGKVDFFLQYILIYILKLLEYKIIIIYDVQQCN